MSTIESMFINWKSDNQEALSDLYDDEIKARQEIQRLEAVQEIVNRIGEIVSDLWKDSPAWQYYTQCRDVSAECAVDMLEIGDIEAAKNYAQACEYFRNKMTQSL